jgi:polyhydroxyalkanoate synthase
MSAAPDAWAREAAEAQRRLGVAARELARLGDVAVGATPRDAAYVDGPVTLWRYRSLAQPSGLPPVLVVYALVNRPYVLDLEPDRSLLRGLLQAGLDVWLLDWGTPSRADRWNPLEDYVVGHLGRAVAHVRAAGGEVDLLGVCQGGTFALCYAALEPAHVRRLVTMVTPVDFHTPENLLAKWARGLDVGRFVDACGNVPGELLNAAFLALMPFRLGIAKYAALADDADDPAALATFLRMEKWIFDSPDQPGEAFRHFVDAFYRRNALAAGTLELGGRRVDLARVTMPVLNVYATRDHLVPPSASRPLGRLVGSRDYRELTVPGGHVGIYVSRGARELPGLLAGWLGGGAR